MMNKILLKLLFTVLAVLLAAEVMAQVPQGFNFQAVARDANGDLIVDQSLGVQISILSGSETGTVVYTETQNPETNTSGSFQIVIGEGTSEDNFGGIDWSSDNFYVKLEIDPAGGTSYEELGTTRLLSVPYALLAQDVVNGSSGELGNEFTLNSSEGDTSFIVNAIGTTGLTAIRGNASTDGVNYGVTGTANSTSTNSNTMYGVFGTTPGDGTGTHIGVIGSAINENGTNGRRYGLYGQARSQGRENIGGFGVGTGPGDGEVVAIGNEFAGGSFNVGGFNIGLVGFARDNLNGNIGLRGYVYGTEGARENRGVSAEAVTKASGRNVGVQAIVHSSQSENIGYQLMMFDDGSGNSTPVNNGIVLDMNNPATESNKGMIANVNATAPDNTGLEVNVSNGENSNIGLIVNAATAAELNGLVNINGDLNVTGTISSGGSGASSTQQVYVENETGDGVANITSHGTNNKQGIIELYGETPEGNDGSRAVLAVSDNGGGDAWGSLNLRGPVFDSGFPRSFVNAFVTNDPGGNDPTGWFGQLDLQGNSSPNILMGATGWESSDLPMIQLFGNKPNNDGWFYNHANFSVNRDGDQEWGTLSLSANDGVANVEIGAKSWEDPIEGAGRPYMSFKGNNTTDDMIYMEVSHDGTNEFGNLNFNSTDGSALSINAYGLNGDVNIDGGNLHVSGNITAGGTITETSDRNLKENIQPLQNGVSTIMKLNPSTYNFRGNGEYNGLRLSPGLRYGLIAQEVEEVLPSLVQDNIHTYTESVNSGSGPDVTSENEITKTMEYKTMNYTELVPILIKAVQEQQEVIEQLQKEVEKLKKN